MEREVAIKTDNVSVIYDRGKPSETKALSDVNIIIYKEDFVVFFGPSGCGKSTMLYTVSGIEKPTTGKILVFDKDITQFSPIESARFHRAQIGMVFQAYNLIPTLTVADNVALPQIFRGVSRAKRLLRAKILLQRFGILPQADRLPTELSGGQQQRVGIARALINEQPIIFADEPVGNLDSKSAKIVLDILYDLNVKDKKTVILVTHDPSLLKYATHIIYMKDGLVVGEKRFSPEQREITVSSQLEQPFVSSPPGIGYHPMTIPSTESSAAEKSKEREEMAKKLVETIQIDKTESAKPQITREPKIIISPSLKELTIGELMQERRKQEQTKK